MIRTVAHTLLPLTLLVACGDNRDAPTGDASTGATVAPTANAAREIVSTGLSVDVTTHEATATITFAGSANPGATLETGDLVIGSVSIGDVAIAFSHHDGVIDLALPAGDAPVTVTIPYLFKRHEGFDGASATGWTFTWPYFCGNLFPCHSAPSDGTTFTLDVHGVPTGKTAVYPAAIASDAPSYMLAWSVDEYTELPLGMTTAGTKVTAAYLPGQLADVTAGTKDLTKAFDWFEKTLGAYRFGTTVGPVSINWGPGAYGGMEHHPRWHVAQDAIGDEDTNTHEAAHGWFGDGIRLRCWEDFVLSEGTVSYLAARALEVVDPPAGVRMWTNYARYLATGVDPKDLVWPDSCNSIDILADNLFTFAPYVRGAFFYRAVALKVGAAKVDQALGAFYQQYGGKVAGMSDMLATIKTVTGYDATTCANAWMRSDVVPAIGPCL